MEKTYEPARIEAEWREFWEREGCYTAGRHQTESGTGEPYCIQIPPPNVTGTLHMGHAFQHTVMDALIRHARMSGKDGHEVAVVDRQSGAARETSFANGGQINTIPFLAPGTAPLTSRTFSSGRTSTTFSPITVTRAFPFWPAIFLPFMTRPG
jgi:hypothetical protein